MEILFLDNNLILIESFLLAFIVTYVSIPSIVEVARLKHLYDEPNGRTSHDIITPTLGGLAIFSGFVISSMIFMNITEISYIQYVMASLLVIFFLGLKDDIVGLSPMKKFIGQIIAAGIVIDLGGVHLSSLYGFVGVHDLNNYSSDLLSLFVIIALINALNLIDGIDGLASGIGVIVSVTFGIWFYFVGEIQLAIISAALAGALLGFFRYNVFSIKNKLFMGDIGSLMLGFMLSILAIKFMEVNKQVTGIYNISSSPAVAIGVLIIPIYDTVRVFVIRLANGKSPFRPDKRHVHHYLLQITGSHRKSTFILLAVNIFFIAISILLQHLSIIVLTGVLFALASGLSFIPYSMAKKKRLRLENKAKENKAKGNFEDV